MADEPAGQRVDVHLLQPLHELGVQVVVVQVVAVHDLGTAGGSEVSSCAASPVVRLRRKSRRIRASTGLASQASAPAAAASARTAGVGSEVTTTNRARRAVAAQPAEHRGAVLPGHRHVGDDEVGVVVRGLAEGVVGVGGLADLPAAEAEQAGDAAAGVGLVVDDEGGQHRNQPRLRRLGGPAVGRSGW